jgi:hypothetical protein
MDLIQARDVIRCVERYFDGGALQFLRPKQARRATTTVQQTAANPFDHQLNLITAGPAAADFIAQLGEAPRTFKGRGIVICGGGLRFFPGVWVTLNMLRLLGCSLPVQVWHLGPEEADLRMKSLTAPLNAVWIDADELRASHPARSLGGWELKVYALMHCPFKEVLLLDADNVPVLNPEYLFETPQFKKTGAVFWPDQNLLEPQHIRWRIFGVPRVLNQNLKAVRSCWIKRSAGGHWPCAGGTMTTRTFSTGSARAIKKPFTWLFGSWTNLTRCRLPLRVESRSVFVSTTLKDAGSFNIAATINGISSGATSVIQNFSTRTRVFRT